MGERGFSLLEIVVTLLLISVGLLGNLTLTARTLRQHQQGIYQARAVLLASSIAESLRSHPSVTPVAAPDTPPDCSLSACDSTQWALLLAAQWQIQAQAQLPNGTVAVNSSATQMSIRVEWRERLAAISTNYSINVARTP